MERAEANFIKLAKMKRMLGERVMLHFSLAIKWFAKVRIPVIVANL